MNVYTTKFMNISVWSTARKAVESVKRSCAGGELECYDDDKLHEKNIDDISVEQLIAHLGKHGMFRIDLGDHDWEEVEKIRVY